jgi:hypothetical protein
MGTTEDEVSILRKDITALSHNPEHSNMNLPPPQKPKILYGVVHASFYKMLLFM